MRLSDIFLFLREWVRSPLRVAAIAPSSRALARLITRDLSSRTGVVLELGPGTGAFTRAMLDRGVSEKDLALVEYSAEFAQLLKSRYPQARVFRCDAADLATGALFSPPEAGAIVCGLGLLSMSEAKVRDIMRGALRHLRPDGAFYLFTYGAKCPVPARILAVLGLSATRVGKIWLNLPPASVYRITRKS